MTEDPDTRARAVGTFYDIMGTFLQAVYGQNLHYGYWVDEADDSPMPVAQDRLNDVLAERLGVTAGHRVLDIGCGTGGPTRRVAHLTGASVTGVSLSAWQVERANQLAVEEGLAGRATFEQADACALPYPADSFDAAMALEVLVHITDKSKALAELLRVVRPGGALVFAELTLARPMDDDEAKLWAAMPMSTPPPQEHYVELVRAAGFVVDEASDVTPHIRRSFGATREAVAREAERLAGTYGPRTLRQVSKAVLDLQAVAERCLGYLVLRARRPG